jgi:RNA polymerase sigma-70 factor (ECF subfamily)
MRGDRTAIELLWDMHRRWVAAVLLAHKPSFTELEDLLQEVAMTFVAKIDTLREPSNLRAWLRVIAVNTARAAGRSGKYRQRADLPPEDALAGPDGEVGAAEADERVASMMRRLQRLPAEYREPLLLRAVHGLRSKRIAEILGVQPATVDTRVARARRMLREAGREGSDEDGGHNGETSRAALDGQARSSTETDTRTGTRGSR